MVTKISYIGRAEAEPLERLKTESEKQALHDMAQDAMREVRETLMMNLDQISPHHRETIKGILGIAA